MTSLRHAKETMTSKERVRRTFEFEKTDRVPMDYSTNPTIHQKLATELGVPDGDYEKVFQALGIDYRAIGVPFIGENKFEPMPDRFTDPVWGQRMRWVENEYGGYMDYCDFPLKDADPETIDAFHVPSPDEFDYSQVEDICRSHDGYSLYVGNPGTADILNSCGMVMSVEDILCNIAMEDEATLRYIDRRLALQLGILERILERGKGMIDFMWIGEDLGTQHAPIISMEMYRSILRPRHQLFVDLAKAYNLPVMVHTCGSSSWVYEDFIEMGINAVDTLQPEAANMSPQYLKDHFGGRLSFHGCISTAGALAYGTVEDVIQDVKNTLEIMMPGGGYHFSPTHMIQDNSPVENVIAMYQAGHDYGVYK